jgi:hypothetical protein
MGLFMRNIKPHVSYDGGEDILINIMEYNPPHCGNNEEGGSLLDLGVDHNCNESHWELKDGRDLT